MLVKLAVQADGLGCIHLRWLTLVAPKQSADLFKPLQFYRLEGPGETCDGELYAGAACCFGYRTSRA